MSATAVIAHYEALARLTARMHETALRGEWESLLASEQQRSELVAAIRPLDAATRLDAATQQHKNALIAQVLASDAEIRALVRTWMEECDLSMESTLQELRLLRKYGVQLDPAATGTE